MAGRGSLMLLLLALAASRRALPAPAPTSAPVSPWGVASSAEWHDQYPRFLPMVAGAGVTAFRHFPEWQAVQPRADTWNWHDADAFVRAASASGVQVCGGFWYFAGWATPTGDTRTAPLNDMGDWSRYVAATVSRYRGVVRHWEVYSEFNGSFAISANKPRDYAALVSAAHAAARRSDPSVRIGLSCANFDVGFLDAAIRAGAAGHFDFVAVHPYENLGALAEGGEAAYLSMAGSLRRMLAANGQPRNLPLWITEMGVQAPIKPDTAADRSQADILVKGHVLALAQGFERIFWFEARGPAYGSGSDHGLIRHDWSERPALRAYSVMTRALGRTPRYIGWLDIGRGGYGFAFQGVSGPVLAAWAPPGGRHLLAVGAGGAVTDLSGGRRRLAAREEVPLTRTPVFVTGLPARLVARARSNAPKPFPWGRPAAGADGQAWCRLGATNIDRGLEQVRQDTTEVVSLLEETARSSMRRRADAEGRYAYFRVAPAYASYGDRALEISVTARRRSDGDPVSIDVCYESLTGYTETHRRWEVPAGARWSTHTWRVDDANFVGGWGWNIRTDIGGSQGDVLLREVRVRRLRPRAPGGQ